MNTSDAKQQALAALDALFSDASGDPEQAGAESMASYALTVKSELTGSSGPGEIERRAEGLRVIAEDASGGLAALAQSAADLLDQWVALEVDDLERDHQEAQRQMHEHLDESES